MAMLHNMNVCLKYTLTPPVSASVSQCDSWRYDASSVGSQIRERGEAGLEMSGPGSDWSFIIIKHPVLAPVKSLSQP